VCAIGLLLLVISPARTDDSESSPTPGALRVHRGDGTVVEMPLRHTEVSVEITAFVARATVEQTFFNPFDEPVEAVYTFPLGDRAAVDDFELEVGERVIRGEIRRQEEAREVYQAAKRAGYRAALLDQERPNIFTQSVANLEPGHEIKIRIRTVEAVPYEDGIYQWTFPLVVGPRYVPGGRATVAARQTPALRNGADGSAGTVYLASNPVPATEAVPDAPRITPAVLAPSFRSGHDVAIRVALDAGVPIASLSCPSQRTLIERSGASAARVRLAPDDSIPNKDFILRWNVSSAEPAVGLLAHRSEIDGFFTLLVQPKGEIDVDEATPKEIVFVLDSSGSMSGLPLMASKRFIRQALSNLGSRDTFNLIRFSSGASTFSPEPLFNDMTSIERALEWVEQLRSRGGTEMLKGFRAAFALPPDPDRIRIVIFLTDGYIGNEHQILAAIAEVVGEARIFTLGIGSSVNHYLLDRMARLGSGAYTFVSPTDEVDDAVRRFRAWVTKPYLTDVEIDWGALPIVDVLPERLPDLFSGQTLNVVGRFIAAGSGDVVVRGRLGGSYWEQRVPVALPESEEGHASLASIWARRRIAELMLSSPGAVTEALRAEVTALALEYRLMSAFTSFVAVDDTEVVNPGGESATVRQAVPLPESVAFEGIFGPAGPPVLRDDESPIPVRIAEELLELREEEQDVEYLCAGGTGGLHITVVSGSGPLPGATVTLRHPRGYVKAVSALSDAGGVVEFPVLRSCGGYRVDVTFPGYGRRRIDDIPIRTERVESITVQLADTIQERVRVTAEVDVVDLEKTSACTKFSDELIADLPVPGRFYQNVLTLAPGLQDADGEGNPNVHGSRSRDYKAVVGGISNVEPLTGPQGMQINPNSIDTMEVITAGVGIEFGRAQGGFARIVQAQGGTGSTGFTPPSFDTTRGTGPVREALRVLADVAEDGELSPADGIPALAALMAAQSRTGSLSHDVRWHALASWALVEASAALPDDPWLRASTDRAVRFLADLLSSRSAGESLASSLDEPTARWCVQFLFWLSDEQLPGRTTVEDYLSMLEAEEAGLSDPALRALDRLVEALPNGNLALTDF
jgi:Ca-activated chloride channel family protein